MIKVGVYVDVSNLAMNGGFGMRYEILRAFACRGNSEAVRLSAYVSFDSVRARTDNDYRIKQDGFHSALRDVGFKVIRKETKWYTNDDGKLVGKSNVDMELAVDSLLQSDGLDRIIIATGDGDFVQVVRALQNKGCRVEVVAFDNVSSDLRQEADLYISGYLIPGLLPINRDNKYPVWGGAHGCARGIFQAYDTVKNFGWLRYLTTLDSELWRVDSRDPESPYKTVFCHESELPSTVDAEKLPNRNMLFEFQIAEGNEQGSIKAVQLKAINART